ncbi:MAG: extracellular solute-binding protein [Spirochaetaceae bacterium]|jgi:raffinose/stachyose/melibiose transport system substrate-binding protein|nr:extracellular solute-binding protein [Spirochaetaceae bacterium]
MKLKGFVFPLVLCVLGVFAATGCQARKDSGSGTGQSGGTNDQTGGKERIRVVTFFAGSDTWVPAWKAAIEEYQGLNPNVVIVDESQPMSGVNNIFETKIRTDLASKNPADIVLYYTGEDAQTLSDSDLFIDWTKYLQEDTAWSQHLLKGPLASGKTDSGVQITLPFIGYYEGLIYNKDLFDKYGLPEPTTWQNILDSVDVFKKNGVYAFCTTLTSPHYLLELLILAQVGAAGQARILDNSWAPALNAVTTLYDKGAFPPDTLSSTEDMVQQLFIDGKGAMIVNGSWFINNIKDQPGMRVIAFPALPGGTGDGKTILTGFGSGWYVSKKSVDRSQESLKFVKWLTSPSTVAKFLAYGGISAIDLDPTVKTSPVEQSGVQMMIDASAARPAANSQMTHEAWNSISNEGLPRLVTKQTTALELLATARQIQESAR